MFFWMKPNPEERWERWVQKVYSREIPVEKQDYPQRLEGAIQVGVQLKRKGKFDAAIGKYLDILEKEKKAYPGILDILYKAVISSGKIDFAYEVIAAAEITAKVAWGRWSAFGPWVQEIRRIELEEALSSCRGLGPSDRDKIILNVMKRYSGGAPVSIPPDIEQRLNRCYESHSTLREVWAIMR